MGSEKGMPISITSAPAPGKPEMNFQRGLIIRVARGDERDEGRASLGFQFRETALNAR